MAAEPIACWCRTAGGVVTGSGFVSRQGIVGGRAPVELRESKRALRHRVQELLRKLACRRRKIACKIIRLNAAAVCLSLKRAAFTSSFTPLSLHHRQPNKPLTPYPYKDMSVDPRPRRAERSEVRQPAAEMSAYIGRDTWSSVELSRASKNSG